MQQLRALTAEKVSIVCGFLFTLLVRDRTPENIIMTAPRRKSEKTGPNHGKLQLFAEESDRWSVKQGICIARRPTRVIFGEADPALYGVFCNSSNR
jgi:hypothetical protein